MNRIVILLIILGVLMGCLLNNETNEDKGDKADNIPVNEDEPEVIKLPNWTAPVIFNQKTDAEDVKFKIIEEGSGHSNLAKVVLILKNLPEDKNGEEFTLAGGGVGVGFHGPNSTNFEGKGYHFAGGSGNPPRDENYKKDFTRKVENNQLEFTFYYEPTDIIKHWDKKAERYVKGSEVTLSLHPKGSWGSVLISDVNKFNWCIAGVGAGNAAEITIEIKK